MPLTLEERQEFLARPHVAALSVAAGPDRAPLTLPIWYQYEPGSEPWVLTGPDTRKMRLIQAAGRFSLMVDVVEPTVRYVTVEGPVSRVEPMTEAMHLEMVGRYLEGDRMRQYLKQAEAFGPQVAVYLRPEHWLSADLG
ncbi:pyridoxamine 5'-phosphate oxidase family protein [Nocardia sp. NPDC052566]|uniref:pyridoxamine 5'-phosphate oxidase family protein n=1 Tax=Nocardia sp. NPDC052566 TaxID=3364330 RepID=UPI0037C56BB5